MVTCTKKKDGEDCDRNYRNRTIVEACPENKDDLEKKKPIYGKKNCCLFAIGDQ